MVGLLGYLAAGAAEGVGKGIAEEGKARREHMLKMLESDSLLDRQKKLEDYKVSKETNLITGQDGDTYNVRGGKAERFTGPDGKPLNVMTSREDRTTAEMKNAQYLLETGQAKTPEEAWEKATSGRSKNISPLDVEKAFNDALKAEFPEGYGRPTPEQKAAVRAEVERRLGVAPPSNDDLGGAATVSTKAEAMALPVGKRFQYNGGTYEVVSPGKFRKVD